MTTPEVPLRMELTFELPGTPEQVWDAIATGNGISAWFIPTDLEPRVGGAVEFHMGDDSSKGTVTDYDAPHRIEYSEPDWASLGGHADATVTPLVTEFLVEARSGGTCMLRVVSSAFGVGAEWEQEFFTEMEKSWTPFFENLRLYLVHFPGQKVTSLSVDAQVPGPSDAVWTALRNSLGGQEVGEPVDARGVSAQVERVSGDPKELLLRVTDPVPGYIGMSAYDMGDGKTLARVEGYLFSDDAPAYVERERAGWKAWLADLRGANGLIVENSLSPARPAGHNATMTIEIRPTKIGEHRAAAGVTAAALMFPVATDEEWAKREASWVESDSVTAWDGDRCVGNARAFTVDTTVPGGERLPMSAVTSVGVLPTYTRRGLLSGMMERLLRDARTDGRVLAGLRASEAVIYRRFGFGVAGEATSIRVRARAARPVHAVPDGTMRLLQKDEVLAILPDLYDRCARRRAGSMSRPPRYLERGLEDVLGGIKPSFVAVHSDPSGTMDGYVKYSIAWDESENDDVGKGVVDDLFGADAAVERALWAYLLGIDLIDEWRSEERPIDEAVRFAFADMRAHRVRDVWDEQWLRLLDVDAALRARSYRASDQSVVIGVHDPWFADNVGTWRVEASGAKRTDAAPDLEVAIDAMSAAYLGGTSWRELADAGQVGVHRAAAVDEADTLFAEHPAPFCGSFY